MLVDIFQKALAKLFPYFDGAFIALRALRFIPRVREEVVILAVSSKFFINDSYKYFSDHTPS